MRHVTVRPIELTRQVIRRRRTKELDLQSGALPTYPLPARCRRGAEWFHVEVRLAQCGFESLVCTNISGRQGNAQAKIDVSCANMRVHSRIDDGDQQRRHETANHDRV